MIQMVKKTIEEAKTMTKQTEIQSPEVEISDRNVDEEDPCNCDTSEAPDVETLIEWDEEGGCEATDGCWVEPDGVCPHGCQSWLLELGLI
jgi:hypothetical protein